MISLTCQRWNAGRDSYRPAGEPINPQEFEISEIPDDKTAKNFVLAHHYSGTYPAARFRFGLYQGESLVGVAVFSHPSNQAVLRIFPGETNASTELGRFVLLDQVPANGESFFLARCFALLKEKGILGIVSFSDPVPRTNLQGENTFKGHIGTIYQATNAAYLGRATARTLRILPNGTVFSDRAISKIRAKERGWNYAAESLTAFGAPEIAGDHKEWLATWLPKITKPLKHPGNHRYAWILPKRDRKFLPTSLPYPKLGAPTRT